MAKVLLLNPPGKNLYLRDQYCSSASKANYYWPPVDLIMQSGILAQRHQVEVLDAIIERYDFDQCFERLARQRYDFILFLTGVASWEDDLRFLARVKQASGCRVIASGGLLLHYYRELMAKNPFLDAVLLNFTSPRLLDYCADPAAGAAIPNVVYRLGESIVEGGLESPRVFELPPPRHEIFPLRHYRLPHSRRQPITATVRTFGCLFKCDFCIASKLPFQYRPTANVMAELKHIRATGIREVFFKDFTFEVPRDSVVELCQAMIAARLDLTWICSSRVDTLDEELLQLIRAAGCHTIQFGVESGSQAVLDAHRKNIQIEQTRRAFALCKKYRIRTLGHFILGLPGETRESILATLQLAKELDCDYASFNIAIPQAGTDLRAECLEQGWLKEGSLTMDSSRAYPLIETAQLSREELWRLRNQAIRSFYLRPAFIGKKLRGLASVSEARTLFREGWSLLWSTLTAGRNDKP